MVSREKKKTEKGKINNIKRENSRSVGRRRGENEKKSLEKEKDLLKEGRTRH